MGIGLGMGIPGQQNCGDGLDLQDLERVLARPDFQDNLAALLGAREKRVLPPEGMVTAAVLAPLFVNENRLRLLLTKRSQHVEHHKGEISFPGGKFDDEDDSFLSCALRETSEEIGVSPDHVRILGELDDFYTVATQYLVTPFVGVIPYPYDFRPSAREISELISVPFDIFFDPTRRKEYIVEAHGRSIPVVSYTYHEHVIWGATARIIDHFVNLILSCDRAEKPVLI